jgi:hypothetical protein
MQRPGVGRARDDDVRAALEALLAEPIDEVSAAALR